MMDNPLTAMLLFTATTGNWFSNLSDTKKGIAALFGAVVLGFAIGTATVAQVGLPQRVELLEERVGFIEAEHIEAMSERNYILDILEWNVCAIEASEDALPIHAACGSAPIRRNR